MNDAVMVIPADRCQVVRMVVSTPMPGNDMVGLKSVGGSTAVDHAPIVSGKDESTQTRRYRRGGGADCERLPGVGDGGDFDG